MGLRAPRTRLARGLLLVAITAALFLLVEGLASLLLAIKETGSPYRAHRFYYTVAPEKRHAQYDAELGWVSIPDVHLPDLYGEGKYLRTNSRGFRTDHPVAKAVPDGKLRVICSGDSFTFGQGVANDKTWCHQLSVLDDRLESVNMGQRGYGVDQAYLWYMRDGLPLDHDLHVFAFIGADFTRMKHRRHKGYGKPVLRLRRGELEVANVPAPEVQRRAPGPLAGLGRFARALRTVEAAQRLLVKARPILESSTREVALEVFDTLLRVNRDKGSLLVLVYLPVQWELEGEDSRWRLWLQKAAGETELMYVDLTPEMRAVAPEVARRFFIGKRESDYVDAAGHYSERGHAWVAETLYRHFMESAEVRAALGRRASTTQQMQADTTTQ